MRLLLDTNIVVYMATDLNSLNQDVYDIVFGYENQLYMSIKSVEELIVAYRHKGLWRKK